MSYISDQIQKVLRSGPESFLSPYRYLIFASLGLFTVGFGIKSAFIPVHAWLPDAHSKAPSSISAMLSGLVVKVTGIFLIIRFYYSIFKIPSGLYGQTFPIMLLFIGGVTAIGGSIFAIAQSNLKRMLAFSTVAQIGYLVIGISLFSKDALTGTMLHLINHTFMKSTLFLAAGAIMYKTNFTEIDEFRGLGFKMPITCACFTVAALGMIGIPPTSGFFSKWVLCVAAIRSGVPLAAAILLIGSLLNAVYYFRVIGRMYFFTKVFSEGSSSLVSSKEQLGKETLQKFPVGQEVPKSMYIPIIIMALAVLFFGFGSDLLLEIIKPGVDYLWSNI